MYFTKLVVMPLLATSLVQSASIKATPTPSSATLEALLSRYTAINIEWNVQINASLPSIAVNGTVQDVVAHLAAIHPEYVATLEKTITERKLGAAGAAAALVQGRSRQTDLVPQGTEYYCNHFEDAMYEDIQAGVSYLEGLAGTPTLGPGPGTCNRVSCSWDSAIWWCNDNAKTESLNSFFDIAIGALEIMEHCTSLVDGESYTKLVNGQQFFRGGWNVIITAANC